MDARLVKATTTLNSGLVDSLILHDDIVPRASAKNVLALFEELSEFSQKWPNLLRQDFRDFTGRIRRLWEPHRRGDA